MMRRVLAVASGEEAPERDVIDWYGEQRERGNLTTWELCATAMATSARGRHTPSQILRVNVTRVLGRLYNAHRDPYPNEVCESVRDELLGEIDLLSEWLNAFVLLDASGDGLTSENFLMMLPHMYMFRLAGSLFT